MGHTFLYNGVNIISSSFFKAFSITNTILQQII